MQTKPQAIIFDWDNTLADSWPILHAALCGTFMHMDKEPWTIQETIEYSSRSLTAYFPPLFGEKWEDAAKVFYDEYHKAAQTELTLLPHAKTLLDKIKDQNIYMAVVSNKKGDILRKEAKRMNLDHYFGKLIGSLDAVEDKPSHFPVLAALDQSGIMPSEDVWFIGDSFVDVECAINSNCLPIFYGPKEKLKQYSGHKNVAHNYECHSEVINLVEKF